MRNKKLQTIFYSFLIILGGCKSAQKVVGTTDLKPRSSKFLLKKLNAHKLDAEWLSSKAKISFRDDYQARKFSANIRLRKDSVIWMNFKKTGVEAARILITPDSVFLINRLDNEYAKAHLEAITDRFYLPQLRGQGKDLFPKLQALLLGNPIFFQVKELNTSIKKDQYCLSGNDENLKSEYWLEGARYLLTKMAFADSRYNRKAQFHFSDFQQLEKYDNFPYIRSLDLTSDKSGRAFIEIKLTKVEINVPKKISFEIPSHYTRIE